MRKGQNVLRKPSLNSPIGNLSWKIFIFLNFCLRFNDETHQQRIPLPNTLNKFLSFGFISETAFKDQFRTLDRRNIFSSEEIYLNPSFIERIEDFQRFLPEMTLLPSNKLKGSFMKNKKLGGVITMDGTEILLRIVMNYERQVIFQVGAEKANIGVKVLAEDLIDVLCFLFGNI